jgi:membrane associated rhomboid family serine protease
MFYERSNRFGVGGLIPPAVKNLIFINGVVYLMLILNNSLGRTLMDNFALSRYDIIHSYKIWQFITYLFLHDPGGFLHILFNMLFLWMFGAELEREWGTREFLKYYFITGVGAGVLNILLSPAPTIGASGAIYGVMLAYALRFPDRLVYVYLLFPVKVKFMMGFLTLVSFISTFSPYSSGIAHAAHLGGILIGYFYLRSWTLFYKIKSIFGSISQKKADSNMKFTKGGTDKTDYYRRKIDELLDKINRVGYLNLSEEEKKMLEEGSRYLREHEQQKYH